jgi:hypothetical protein
MSKGISDDAAAPLRLTDLVREAWGAASGEELAVIEALSAGDCRVVAERLKALLAVERGERAAFSELDDGSRFLSPAGFQALVSRWRKSRHISTLIPYATRKARGRAARHDEWEVKETAQRLVRENLRQSIETLARNLMDHCSGVRSLNTAKTLIREARTIVRLQPESLREDFGGSVLIDQTAVEVRSGDNPLVLIVATLAIEEVSGLVLGSSTSRYATLDPQIGEVGEQAIEFLAHHVADRWPPPDCHLSVVVGFAPELEVAKMASLLRGRGTTVIDSPRRMIGDRVALHLDGQIGGLRLRPRSTAAALLGRGYSHLDEPIRGLRPRPRSTIAALIGPDEVSPAYYQDAERELVAAIDRHNGNILERLREAGLIGGGGVRAGTMAEALCSVLGPQLSGSHVSS